jgi:hypothetical protein
VTAAAIYYLLDHRRYTLLLDEGDNLGCSETTYCAQYSTVAISAAGQSVDLSPAARGGFRPSRRLQWQQSV